LDLVDERILWVNALRGSEEHRMGPEFGFRVLDPTLNEWSKVPPGGKSKLFKDTSYHMKPYDAVDFPNPLRMIADNSYTFPVSFYWSVQMAQSDVLIVLEKDWQMDLDLSYDEMVARLFTAVYMMAVRGVGYIRLRSRKDLGSAGLPDCVAQSCGWSDGHGTWQRQANHFNFYNGVFSKKRARLHE